MTDTFKIIQTAPEFAYAATGSYSFDSFKNSFKSTSKKPLTGSTVLTSGIIDSNAPVYVTSGDTFVPPIIIPPWDDNIIIPPWDDTIPGL